MEEGKGWLWEAGCVRGTQIHPSHLFAPENVGRPMSAETLNLAQIHHFFFRSDFLSALITITIRLPS